MQYPGTQVGTQKLPAQPWCMKGVSKRNLWLPAYQMKRTNYSQWLGNEWSQNLEMTRKWRFWHAWSMMDFQVLNFFWDFRHNLTSIDDVVVYMDRIVIPRKLKRGRIIENLHSAHQGTSGMFSRAQSVVFWPGITVDIDEERSSCRTCHRNYPHTS